MDEIAILAAAAAFVLGGGVGALINHTYHDYTPAPMGLTSTYDSAHIHEAVSVGRSGWSCVCGKHYHRYINGRCACGERGTVDRWPTT